MKHIKKNQPQEKSVIKINKNNLPIYCPHDKNKLWCMHPKVYLPMIIDVGEVNCPYCGQLFELVAEHESNL